MIDQWHDTRGRPWPQHAGAASEWPVADLVLPLPLDVAADVYWALGRLEERGYEVFVREANGLGRCWVRRPAEPDISPADNEYSVNPTAKEDQQ